MFGFNEEIVFIFEFMIGVFYLYLKMKLIINMVNFVFWNNIIELKLGWGYCSLCVVIFLLEKENISFIVLCINF